MLFYDLTTDVRLRMVREFEQDQVTADAYVSPRLTPSGLASYPQLLRSALTSHDVQWLIDQLNRPGVLKTMEERKGKNGTTMAKVPHTAAMTLAEGDFNRYYIRGLCTFLLESDAMAEVEVYRAKLVENPRPESTAVIGKRLFARAVRDDLIRHRGDLNTTLGIPAGPNSGLSVRIPAQSTLQGSK